MTLRLALLALSLAFAACQKSSPAPASKAPAKSGMGMQAKAPGPNDPSAPRVFDAMPPAGTKATCAVSGEVFTIDADTTKSVYKGKTYVFCCDSCKPTFDEDPAKFAAN